MKRAAGVNIGIVMPLAEQRGGAEMALMHFLHGLRPDVQRCVRLCFLEAGPMVQWARERDYPAEVLEAGRLRQLPRWTSVVRGLHRWLRENDIGVVLSWMAKGHLYAGPAAWLARIPALWWQHGVPTRRGLDSLVSLVPAQRIIACSQAAARAQRRLSGDRSDLVTVYPGVDLQRLRRAETTAAGRRILGLPDNALIIGIVARLERWKGIDTLVRAFAALRTAHPQLHLVVVGGPHPLQPGYADEVQSLPRQLGVEQHVTFCGHQADAAKWMCEMDIVVSASFGEPFGMVIVEAMALGKAVVATNSGGAPEIVTDGVNGMLVMPGDVSELVGALSRLVGSQDLRRDLGSSARARAADFSAQRFIDRVLAVVRQRAA